MPRSKPVCPSPCEPAELARTLLALADPIRMRMLSLMLDAEMSFEEFSKVLSLGSYVISRHLTLLRDGRLIGTRRRGRTTYYLVRKKLSSIQSQFLHLTLGSVRAHSGFLRTDFELLNSVEQSDHGRRAPNGSHRKSEIHDPPSAIRDHGPVPDSTCGEGWSHLRT
jgi:DNA-binding transcriptional ArsR family regulator